MVEHDLASIAKFQPPDGRLVLAFEDGVAVGTAAMQRIGPETAEIKRMWVDPSHRRAGTCGVPIVGPTTDSGSAFVFIDEAAEDRSADYPCVLGIIDRLVGSWRSEMLATVGSPCVVVPDIFAEQQS